MTTWVLAVLEQFWPEMMFVDFISHFEPDQLRITSISLCYDHNIVTATVTDRFVAPWRLDSDWPARSTLFICWPVRGPVQPLNRAQSLPRCPYDHSR